MNWEAIGAIGEMIGAIGVVATLGYLAFQIRQNALQIKQNTLTARAAAVNACNTPLREPRESIYQSAEVTKIFMAGNDIPADLDAVTRLRYGLVMQNIVDTILEVYNQTLATNYSPETWATEGETLVLRIINTNGGQWFWETYSPSYPAQFQEEVNCVLKRHNVKSL